MKKTKVSVIIPTYNEERDISDCILSILNQSYKNLEIIIVDDGSTDKTREIVNKIKKKSNKVKLIEGEHKGPGFSRNLGSKKAKGSIFVFVDADMTFDKDYVKNLVNPILEKRSIGTEERFQKAANLKKIWSRCWGTYTKGYPKKTLKGNVFRAILKDKFLEWGGFNPKYGYADDLTFYFEKGIRSDIVDNAVCYHRNPENLREIYKQSSWIGASLNFKLLKIPVIREILIILSLISLPILIPYLSIKKCKENKNFSLIFPWMIIFITVRYFGSLSGIFRKEYLKKNTR